MIHVPCRLECFDPCWPARRAAGRKPTVNLKHTPGTKRGRFLVSGSVTGRRSEHFPVTQSFLQSVMSSASAFRQRGGVGTSPPINAERSGSFSKQPKIEREQQTLKHICSAIGGAAVFIAVFVLMGGSENMQGELRQRRCCGVFPCS